MSKEALDSLREKAQNENTVFALAENNRLLRAELAECKRTWLSPEELAACNAEIARLRKIEEAAVAVCGLPNWNNDTWIDKMYALDAALKEEK